MDMLTRLDLTVLITLIVVGACGLYLLLPHAHGLTRPKRAHQIGFTLATLFTLLLTLFWRPTSADFDLVSRSFFYLFGFLAVGGAVLTVTSRDPIHSALWFAAVVLATSGLFLMAGAQFLAAGTVIVYAGAIIVTFLFVIMLAQKEGRAIYDRMARSPFAATLTSFLVLFALLYSIVSLRGVTDPKNSTTKVYPGREPLIAGIVRLDRPVPVGTAQTIVAQATVFERSLGAAGILPEAQADRLPSDKRPVASGENHVASLGGALYTQHLVTVELVGALLFVALIGAIAIAAPRTPTRPSTSDAAPNATA